MITTVTHVGTATVVLRVGAFTILTDPVFDPPGSRYRLARGPLGSAFRYASEVGPSMTPEDVGPIDLVLLSHDQHRDNLDRAGLEALRRARLVVTTEGGARRLEAKGVRRVVGLAPWESIPVATPAGAITVNAVPARHGPIGTNWVAGAVIGFVLTSAASAAVYVTGDTRHFSGIAKIADRFAPFDLVFAHVGAGCFGHGPLRRWLRFSMNAAELLRFTRVVRPRALIPIHYEGWTHFGEGRAEIEQAFAGTSEADRLRWLPIGATVPPAALHGHSVIEPGAE